MDTQVRTPQSVFMQPQRLIVPLFQRPYVWNLENQWEPLRRDVIRVAQRLLAEPNGKHPSHFLVLLFCNRFRIRSARFRRAP
jgi:hypothetical protein